MADLAWFSALLILFCSSPGILRQPQYLARERETFGYLFCPCTPYGSRVSLIGEERKKERKKKENDDFRDFVFSACIKLSGNQRTYLYSGGSGLSIDIHFVDIELSYDVLSPLPIVLSKHFNHPHPYIECLFKLYNIGSRLPQSTTMYTSCNSQHYTHIFNSTINCTQKVIQYTIHSSL